MSDTLSTSHHRKQRLYDHLFQYSTAPFAFSGAGIAGGHHWLADTRGHAIDQGI